MREENIKENKKVPNKRENKKEISQL